MQPREEAPYLAVIEDRARKDIKRLLQQAGHSYYAATARQFGIVIEQGAEEPFDEALAEEVVEALTDRRRKRFTGLL